MNSLLQTLIVGMFYDDSSYFFKVFLDMLKHSCRTLLFLILLNFIFFLLVGVIRNLNNQKAIPVRKKKDPKEFDPYAFLIGDYVTADGYDSETILSFTDLDFEQKRGYIWYYFPIRERTSEETLQKIKEDPNAKETISKAFEKILGYWNFYWRKFIRDSGVTPQYIAMTHVGNCLKELGMGKEYEELKELLRDISEYPISPEIKKEWKEWFEL